MEKKIKFNATITFPDGTTYTRKTTRVYTHATICKMNGEWGYLGYSSSVFGAEKLAREFSKRFATIEIVPVIMK